MKKKILGSMFGVAIAAITVVNVNFSAPNNGAAILNLSNVEAFASGETPHICPCYPNGNGCYCHVWYPSYEEIV